MRTFYQACRSLLHGVLALDEFVNADVIASGLSAFNPESAAIAAARVMLARIHELALSRVSFAFETTLASRSFAPWLRRLRGSGYTVELVFLWLPSAAFAAERVAARVRTGGHSVPGETVRRRYVAGLRNFFELYQPLASSWVVYDSSGPVPRRVAKGLESQAPTVYDETTWAMAQEHKQS